MKNKSYSPTNIEKVILVGLFIIVFTFVYRMKTPEETIHIKREPNVYEEQRMMQEQGLIKVHDQYIKYGVKEHGEVKPITDALERNCRDDACKIKNYFNYVKKMPYEKGEINKDKDSVDVIISGKGDCDERAYLLASMLLQGKYKSVIVYTKEHAFVCINMPNLEGRDNGMTFLLINNQRYYYAETTNINAYIGAYNYVDPKQFQIIYDVNKKQEVPMNQVAFSLNQNS
jgi:hypothetical protein